MAKMLFAYGDDSGTHNDARFTCFLGYIGSPRQWKLFRRECETALLTLIVPDSQKREFHAKDFFNTRRWQSKRSLYHGWNNEQAVTFLDRLLDIIHRHDVRPIGGAVNTEHFFQFPELDRKWLTGAPLVTRSLWRKGEFNVTDKFVHHRGSPNRPYFVVFPGFLVEAMRASHHAGNANVHLIFDRQNDAEARAKEAFDEFKREAEVREMANLKTITYAESEDEVGLQAADLYAYVWYRHLTGNLAGRLLSRAFAILTKKKKKIMVADRRYFNQLTSRAIRKRETDIGRARAKKP